MADCPGGSGLRQQDVHSTGKEGGWRPAAEKPLGRLCKSLISNQKMLIKKASH
jgi:hypothetical protein